MLVLVIVIVTCICGGILLTRTHSTDPHGMAVLGTLLVGIHEPALLGLFCWSGTMIFACFTCIDLRKIEIAEETIRWQQGSAKSIPVHTNTLWWQGVKTEWEV
eukprot:scpid42553/ scgid18542/ 